MDRAVENQPLPEHPQSKHKGIMSLKNKEVMQIKLTYI